MSLPGLIGFLHTVLTELSQYYFLRQLSSGQSLHTRSAKSSRFLFHSPYTFLFKKHSRRSKQGSVTTFAEPCSYWVWVEGESPNSPCAFPRLWWRWTLWKWAGCRRHRSRIRRCTRGSCWTAGRCRMETAPATQQQTPVKKAVCVTWVYSSF